MKTLHKFATIAALGTAVLYGQTTPDSSGNSLLKGAYRFRQVAVLNTDTNGNPTEVAGAFGVITFDGKGGYTLAGTVVDNTIKSGAQQAFPASFTGTYAIGTNGLGYLDSPMNVILGSNNTVTGAVAQGIFTGSDTLDGDASDIFIAIPVSTAPTNASFTTTYAVGLLDFTGATYTAMKNAIFKLTPNGQGGFGSISLTGQAANQSSTTVALPVTQTVAGATYNFAADGNATLTVPLPSGVTIVNALFTGAKSMYVSSDGNFVLGWSPGGYDIFFGVSALRASATNAIFQGTYYTSALEDVPTGNGVDNYAGSTLAAQGDGNEIVHEFFEMPGYYAYDYVTDDVTKLNTDGTTSSPDYNGYQYAFGDGGKAFVGIGTYGFFSLVVGTQAPAASGSGVFLSPTGIFNSASYAPITASVAPGELLTMFGSGLASATLSATGGQPFPTSLGGVQVLMNNIPAPIYYVSPGQIAAVVPYSLSPSATLFYVTIQINNKGQVSNSVTLNLTDALPGVFTQNQSGLGTGAVLHAANSTLVTASNPAVAGEYIEVFLTGLGTVTPVVTDGAVGPSNPLSYADQFNSMNLLVFFDDFVNPTQQGTVTFGGLAPGLAGLYQLNVQVPTGVGPGNVYLGIETDFAYVSQVTIPVGNAGGAAVRPRAITPRKGRAVRRDDPNHPRPPASRPGLSQFSN